MVRNAISPEHMVSFIELLGTFVPTKLHVLDFFGLPHVHLGGADESYMHAHVSVYGGALVTQENSDRGTCPCRVLPAAVKASLVLRDL